MEVVSREEEGSGSKQDADKVCDEASVESVTERVKTSSGTEDAERALKDPPSVESVTSRVKTPRPVCETVINDSRGLAAVLDQSMEAVHDEVGEGIKFVSKGTGLAQSSRRRAARPSSLQERVRLGVATSGNTSDSDDDDDGEESEVVKAKAKQQRRKEKKKDKKKPAKEEKKSKKKHKKKDKERRRSKGGDGGRPAA